MCVGHVLVYTRLPIFHKALIPHPFLMHIRVLVVLSKVLVLVTQVLYSYSDSYIFQFLLWYSPQPLCAGVGESTVYAVLLCLISVVFSRRLPRPSSARPAPPKPKKNEPLPEEANLM